MLKLMISTSSDESAIKLSKANGEKVIQVETTEENHRNIKVLQDERNKLKVILSTPNQDKANKYEKLSKDNGEKTAKDRD